MKIGDHVHIGANTVVEAATIGNHVEIGKNCIIVRLNVLIGHGYLKPLLKQGKFTMIKDCAKIADNTVLPPNTVVPALALFSGSPGTHFIYTTKLSSSLFALLGQFVENLAESRQDLMEFETKQYYNQFQPLE